MADYTNEIDSAYADIKAAGVAITLRLVEKEPTYNDPLEPWKGYTPQAGIGLDQSTYGLFVALSKREVDGTRITETMRAMLIPAKGLAPQPTTRMELIAAGTTYSIIAILKTIDFNGQPILHRVAIR